jgi:Fe-S cluster assembly protein SufD
MAGLINNWLEQAATSADQAGWLEIKRQQAKAQLQQLQDPGRKLENWRYADAGRLAATLPSIGELAVPEGDDVWVLTINEQGHQLSANWPAHIEVADIMQIDEARWHDLSFGQETAANLINTLLFSQGVQLQLNGSGQAGQVFVVYDFADAEHWHYVRNQFSVAAGSELTVHEQLKSGRLNVVNVYDLADQAILNRQQHISLNEQGAMVAFHAFEVAEAVQINSMNWHLGGSLQHHIQQVNFNRSNASFRSGSVNKSINNNNIVDIVNVNHHQRNNRSEVTHRSMAKDQSQIYNNAKALVAPGADQSEIEQDLKNILLSEDAKIFSKPELEVYADEVVAAHGSTIGALDDQSLFYLQSRGVPVAEARDIMIESFEQEAVIC